MSLDTYTDVMASIRSRAAKPATASAEAKTMHKEDPLDLAHPRKEYHWSDQDEPHAQRRKEMLKKYPQIRKLMRHEPITKYYVITLVAIQFAAAYWITTNNLLGTWQFWLTAYVVGGTCSSALVLGIHEVTHFLAFKDFLPNKILACIGNLPIVFPFCVEFKKYHMDHHRFQGVDGVDGDVPTRVEAFLFNSFVGKLFYCITQILFYAIRPTFSVKPVTYRMPKTFGEFIVSWHAMNFAIQVPVMALVVYSFGWTPILYFGASVFLGGSIHPMAGHFIAEHYVTSPGYETYSYYGPLNALAFNVGYHNEHHDFPNVPWTLLPELRKIAPEYYNDIPEVKSWFFTIIDFITTPGYGPYSRIKRMPAVAAGGKFLDQSAAGDVAAAAEDDVTSPNFVGKEAGVSF
ncbi:dihydroceramide delta(4)-desaturase [Obelidium mucronatum]|nr:dihydroceramide delta(4)-desaturase [Obelidium mucronatum]